MKQLTCEMCGSTDLLKQDGVFICQSCGTKYSLEEAKKMMAEETTEVPEAGANGETLDSEVKSTKAKIKLSKKKILVIVCAIVVLIGIISGIAVARNRPKSKVALLRSAESVYLKQFEMDLEKNPAKVARDYEGKAIKVSGYVSSLWDDGMRIQWHSGYVTTGDFPDDWGSRDEMFDVKNRDLYIYFAEKYAAADVSKGDHVTIVGIVDDVSYTNLTSKISNAYLVD